MQADPVCTALAGANGSGKSTIYPALHAVGEFVNANVVARMLNPDNPGLASLAAGRRVLQRLDALLRDRESFVYETTLGGHQPIDLMRVAKRRGYSVALVFVVLTSVELNVERVRQRVARGGHDIPEAIIRRRYRTSLSNLSKALLLADECVLFDNTTQEPRLLARVSAGVVTGSLMDTGQPTHERFAEILSDLAK